uniref:Uncharacterized protein n=1 Tax=Magallana gigas TaxID=29159 RepID=K1RER9_MAGGI
MWPREEAVNGDVLVRKPQHCDVTTARWLPAGSTVIAFLTITRETGGTDYSPVKCRGMHDKIRPSHGLMST